MSEYSIFKDQSHRQQNAVCGVKKVVLYVPSPNAVLGAVFQGVFLNILKIFFFALSMLS